MIGIFIKKQFGTSSEGRLGELQADNRKIISNKEMIGKNKKEILDLLGIEDNYFDLDEWSYLIKKNIFGGSVYQILNFNKANQVIKVYKRTLY